jgi:CO/xanthine dehydrogenase FAD-binding subunit
VRPAPFEYVVPRSVDEALDVLAGSGEEGKILAGGQSLVPLLHLRMLRPSVLIDVNRLDLGMLRVDGTTVVIPATATQRDIERSALIRERCPLLGEAIRHVGNVRVRNRGTVGGNLAHADPSTEIGCAALAMRGEVRVMDDAGDRTIALDDLFVTYLTTCLEPTELITELRVPAFAPGTGWAFEELSRRAGEFAIVDVAALLRLDGDGRCADVEVAVAGVGDRPLRMSAAVAEVLKGSTPSDDLLVVAASRVAEAAECRGDIHASSDYRREMLGVFVRRALRRATVRALDASDPEVRGAG